MSIFVSSLLGASWNFESSSQEAFQIAPVHFETAVRVGHFGAFWGILGHVLQKKIGTPRLKSGARAVEVSICQWFGAWKTTLSFSIARWIGDEVGVTHSTFYPCKRADLGKLGRYCTFYPCTPCKYGLIMRSAAQKTSNYGHFSVPAFKSIRAVCVRIRAVGD